LRTAIAQKRGCGLLAAAVLVLFVLGLPVYAQQKIAVRFLDFKSGKGIKNIDVLSVLWNGATFQVAAQGRGVVSKRPSRTDKNGTITIPIPEPVPEHVRISSLDTVNPVIAEFSLSEILKSGTVMPYKKAKSNLQISATAGEIVILTRKLNAGDRIAREIP
jgi:hypothetical protein